MNNIPSWMYLTVAVVFILSVAAVCIWHIQADAVVNASKVQPDIIKLLTEKAQIASGKVVPQRWAGVTGRQWRGART